MTAVVLRGGAGRGCGRPTKNGKNDSGNPARSPAELPAERLPGRPLRRGVGAVIGETSRQEVERAADRSRQAVALRAYGVDAGRGADPGREQATVPTAQLLANARSQVLHYDIAGLRESPSV